MNETTSPSCRLTCLRTTVYLLFLLGLSHLSAVTAGSLTLRELTRDAAWSARSEHGVQLYPQTLVFQRVAGDSMTCAPYQCLMIWGGERGASGAAIAQNDVWVSSNGGESWEILSGPGSRYTNANLRDGSRTADCSDGRTGQIFVAGGTFNGVHTSWISTSTNGTHWTQFPQQSFWPRDDGPCLVDHDGDLFVVGGWVNRTGFIVNGAQSELNDVWHSPAGPTLGQYWQLITVTPKWVARQGHQMTHWYNAQMKTDIIYLFGGHKGSTRYNDIWISADKMLSWVRLSAVAPYSPRMHSSVTVMSDGIIFITGGDCGLSCNKNDVWASLDGGWTWGECCKECGYPLRQDHVSIIDQMDQYVVIGGSENPRLDNTSFNDVWRSNFPLGDASQIARTCGLQLPNCGIGLRCVPGGFCPCSPFGVGVSMLPVNTNPGWNPRFEGGIGQFPHIVSFRDAATNEARTLPAFSLFMWGGRAKYDGQTFNDVWATFSGDEWSLIGGRANFDGIQSRSTGQPIIDLQRTADCYDPTSGRFFSIAGTNSEGSAVTSKVQTSVDAGLSWQQLPDGQFPSREGAACAVDSRGRVFVFGGGRQPDSANDDYYRDVWSSIAPYTLWTRATETAPWNSRTQLDGDVYYSNAWSVNILYMANGYNNNGTTGRTNDIWISTSNGVFWLQVTAAAPYPGRQDAQFLITPTGALVVVGGDMGGNSPGNLNDIWSSLDGGYTWGVCNLTAAFYTREDHVAIFTSTGHLLLTQGEAPYTEFDNTVWRSDVSFFDDEIVSSYCHVPIPDCGVGLRCLPPARTNCRCGYYPPSILFSSTGSNNPIVSSTGKVAPISPESSSSLSISTIVLIVLIVIAVVGFAAYFYKNKMSRDNSIRIPENLIGVDNTSLVGDTNKQF